MCALVELAGCAYAPVRGPVGSKCHCWGRTALPGTCSPRWLPLNSALLLVPTHHPSVTYRNIHTPFLRTWLEPPRCHAALLTLLYPFCCMASMPWEAGRELLMHHEDRQGKKGPPGMHFLPLPQLCCPRSPAAHAAPTTCAAVMSPCHCPLLLCRLGTSTRLAGQSEMLWHQPTQACSK